MRGKGNGKGNFAKTTGKKLMRKDSRCGMCWVENHITHIPLNNGMVALCDEDRFEEINEINWYYRNKRDVYPTGWVSERKAYAQLHKFLYPDINSRLDHINGNKLDNRSCNLRPATNAENTRNGGKRANNTTGFKGVVREQKCKSFRMQIGCDYKRYKEFGFLTAEAAAIAYDLKAIELHGEFARTNFPLENYLPKK